MKRFFIFLGLLLLLPKISNAQTPRATEDLSVNEILEETQLSSDESEDINLMWWIPTEFWRASSASDPTVSQEDQEALEGLIKDYTILAVVKGKIGLFGGVTFEDEQTVRDKFVVTYKSQKYEGFREYKPLDIEKLNPDLVNFFGMIKPILSNMMGSMGENFHLLVYQNDKGKALLQPYSNDQARFKIDDVGLDLNFPIASLIKRKTCEEDGELLKGTWNYCPLHGNKLTSN